MISTHDFLTFIDQSPTPFHAVAASVEILAHAGFVELSEDEVWPSAGGKYFVTRAGSLIAWIEAEEVDADSGFRILGAHTDSPGLRVKPHHDLSNLGVGGIALEPYGGPIISSWFDRDLGLAGRLVSVEGTEKLVDIRESLLRVPNLAIHLDREKAAPNVQQHLNALWSQQPGSLLEFLSSRSGLHADEIAGFELLAIDTQAAASFGRNQEFIAAPRLDNLTTVWSALQALVLASGERRQVIALFDHEEVGSSSERGAGSPFLTTVLERIVLTAGGSRESYHRALAKSIVISGDMAHATHPNFPEKHEPLHRIELGGGPVLKVNANLRYASDAHGAAFFQEACNAAGVPMQRFVNRADLPCGSTIGPISAAQSGILTVDVGAPQLAMHSIRETMATSDLTKYVRALTSCFEIR